jgi:hypothetical protein
MKKKFIWLFIAILVSSCGDGLQSGQAPPATHNYTDNGNGTITDGLTGLMWQKQDDGIKKDWATAGTYCSGLALGGYSTWRLPSVDELTSIVVSGTAPTINMTYFPSPQFTGYQAYWSSTTDAGATTNAFVVSFSGGFVAESDKTDIYSHYVRCVRKGQ